MRTGQADFPLPREGFERRFRARFNDPAFADKEALNNQPMETAWDGWLPASNRDCHPEFPTGVGRHLHDSNARASLSA
jgi:hypothetical protein